jgi:hypothetical protein
MGCGVSTPGVRARRPIKSSQWTPQSLTAWVTHIHVPTLRALTDSHCLSTWAFSTRLPHYSRKPLTAAMLPHTPRPNASQAGFTRLAAAAAPRWSALPLGILVPPDAALAAHLLSSSAAGCASDALVACGRGGVAPEVMLALARAAGREAAGQGQSGASADDGVTAALASQQLGGSGSAVAPPGPQQQVPARGEAHANSSDAAATAVPAPSRGRRRRRRRVLAQQRAPLVTLGTGAPSQPQSRTAPPLPPPPKNAAADPTGEAAAAEATRTIISVAEQNPNKLLRLMMRHGKSLSIRCEARTLHACGPQTRSRLAAAIWWCRGGSALQLCARVEASHPAGGENSPSNLRNIERRSRPTPAPKCAHPSLPALPAIVHAVLSPVQPQLDSVSACPPPLASANAAAPPAALLQNLQGEYLEVRRICPCLMTTGDAHLHT